MQFPLPFVFNTTPGPPKHRNEAVSGVPGNPGLCRNIVATQYQKNKNIFLILKKIGHKVNRLIKYRIWSFWAQIGSHEPKSSNTNIF